MSSEPNAPDAANTENPPSADYAKHRLGMANDDRLFSHQHFHRKTSATSDLSAEGPVRRKSILHNSAHVDHHYGHHVNHGFHPSEEDKHWNGDVHHERFQRSVSRSNSFYSEKGRRADDDTALVNSWWYLFCLKCRQKESKSSWEPPHWQKVCPYPFCPSYRQFARLIALVLVGLLLWGIVYCIIGSTAAPGGQLFGLAVLCICANFGGWLAAVFTLPALSGMLIVGMIFQNVGLVHIDEEYKEVCSALRKIALVIILIRAGLDLDPVAMKRMYFTLIKLGLVPWMVECGVIAIFVHYFLDLPWIWGFLLGSAIAAVSPAVVVPCLLRLRNKGYGISKGIPTLIIAVSGIDDAASVAVFGIIHGIIFSTESLVFNIIQGPVSVVIGIGFGIFWGAMSQFIPEKDDPFVVPLRILLLFGGGLISVFGSEEVGLGGAGPLGCVALAFVSIVFWAKQGWDVEDNPAATAFEIFWMIFEPILFGITGTEVKISEMDPHVVSIGAAILLVGVIIRIIATVLVAFGTKLNMKEKIFAALSWMVKATVQAALGPIALDSIRSSKNGEDQKQAEIILLICILSIIMTAPIGAIIITLTGPKLLTKTSAPSSGIEWRRRSHRPSIRDISIIDEEEEIENSPGEENKDNAKPFGSTIEELEIHEVKEVTPGETNRNEGATTDASENKS